MRSIQRSIQIAQGQLSSCHPVKRLVRVLVWGDPPTWPLLSRRSVLRIPYTATAIIALIPSISSYKYINTFPIRFTEELLCTPNFSFLYEVDYILLGIRPHAIFFHITSQASDYFSNRSFVCAAGTFLGNTNPKDHDNISLVSFLKETTMMLRWPWTRSCTLTCEVKLMMVGIGRRD